jgi:hypothetical protein
MDRAASDDHAHGHEFGARHGHQVKALARARVVARIPCFLVDYLANLHQKTSPIFKDWPVSCEPGPRSMNEASTAQFLHHLTLLYDEMKTAAHENSW